MWWSHLLELVIPLGFSCEVQDPTHISKVLLNKISQTITNRALTQVGACSLGNQYIGVVTYMHHCGHKRVVIKFAHMYKDAEVHDHQVRTAASSSTVTKSAGGLQTQKTTTSHLGLLCH